MAGTSWHWSWRGGKRAATADDITFGDIYLAAGDSNGDIPELGLAENRLAINRMNKPELATVFADAIAEDPSANWMLQPTLSAEFVGFLSNECAMAERTAADPGLTATTQDSLQTLEGTGRLGSFTSC